MPGIEQPSGKLSDEVWWPRSEQFAHELEQLCLKDAYGRAWLCASLSVTYFLYGPDLLPPVIAQFLAGLERGQVLTTPSLPWRPNA